MEQNQRHPIYKRTWDQKLNIHIKKLGQLKIKCCRYDDKRRKIKNFTDK